MEIIYNVKAASEVNKSDLESFLALLQEQGQVQNPSIDKLKFCPLLCIAFHKEKPIAIGALKQVYKAPFGNAGVEELADEFNFELGYFFIVNKPDYRGRGIAKGIAKALLSKIPTENVFATTEESEQNPMKYILQQLNFKQTGKIKPGKHTGKRIGLYLLRC